MPKKGYVSVSIPEELGKDIDKIKRSGHGYRSRAEFVVDAVRRLVTDLKRAKSLEVLA